MTVQNNQTASYVPTLDFARLDEMARVATSQPQHRRASSWSIWELMRFNAAPARLSFATAALVVFLSATVVMTDLPQTDNGASTDVYAEVSDMIILDVMDDMTS